MKIPIACLLVLSLAACGAIRPSGDRQSFLLQPEHGDARAPVRMGEILRIGRISVAPPFEGREFVYRRDEVRYETDFYNGFVADPADMVAAAATGWFRHSGLFREVLSPRAGLAADYRLDAGVSALYVDFRGSQPAAVLTMRWRVLRDIDSSLVLDVDSDERVALGERSPQGTALAYSEALKRALAKVEAALIAARL